MRKKMLVLVIVLFFSIKNLYACKAYKELDDIKKQLNSFWKYSGYICHTSVYGLFAYNGYYFVFANEKYIEHLESFGSDIPAAALAHEWTHLVWPGVGRKYELQADCMSGVWLNHIGADKKSVSQYVKYIKSLNKNVLTHGSTSDRVKAFLKGYNDYSGYGWRSAMRVCRYY